MSLPRCQAVAASMSTARSVRRSPSPTPSRWPASTLIGGRLPIVDLDRALAHRDVFTGILETHDEGRADRPHLDVARDHDEGTVCILGDFEQRLAVMQHDATLLGGILDRDRRRGVEDGDRTVRQGDALAAADAGRMVGVERRTMDRATAGRRRRQRPMRRRRPRTGPAARSGGGVPLRETAARRAGAADRPGGVSPMALNRVSASAAAASCAAERWRQCRKASRSLGCRSPRAQPHQPVDGLIAQPPARSIRGRSRPLLLIRHATTWSDW